MRSVATTLYCGLARLRFFRDVRAPKTGVRSLIDLFGQSAVVLLACVSLATRFVCNKSRSTGETLERLSGKHNGMVAENVIFEGRLLRRLPEVVVFYDSKRKNVSKHTGFMETVLETVVNLQQHFGRCVETVWTLLDGSIYLLDTVEFKEKEETLLFL